MLEANRLPAGAAIAPPSASPAVGDVLETLLAKLAFTLAGGSGVELVSNTTKREYRTIGFIVQTDCVFSLATGDTGYTVTGVTGITFEKGQTLPWRLNEFTLASGSVQAIKA
jgi:hypothetical protein